MSTKLIDLNQDLKRLRSEGYHIGIQEGHLLVRDVPYLDETGVIRLAVLLSPLRLAGDSTVQPDSHTVLFTGEYPHSADGSRLASIECGGRNERIVAGLTVCYEFSAHKMDKGGNKIPYQDYYEKMTSYVRRISHPAASIDPGATAKTHQVSDSIDDDYPFEYLETASARAGITEMQAKLVDYRLGIVGVGGTGTSLRRHQFVKFICLMMIYSSLTTRSDLLEQRLKLNCMHVSTRLNIFGISTKFKKEESFLIKNELPAKILIV